jgi:uncharacterized protein (DUF983 family)
VTNRPLYKPSLFKTAVRGRCPRCCRGALFIGYLRVAPICSNCGLSFATFNTEDGPASLIILPLCFLTAGGSLLLEVMVQPPIWVHVMVWPTVIALAVGFSLRPVKAAVIALQYRSRERNGDAPEPVVVERPIRNGE